MVFMGTKSIQPKAVGFFLLCGLYGLASCSKSKGGGGGSSPDAGARTPSPKALSEAAAKILWDIKKEIPMAGLGITLVQARAWKSFSRENAPTVLSDDHAWLELWYRIDDEMVVRYFHSGALLLDADGTLYHPDRPPGIKTTQAFYAPTKDLTAPNKEFFVSEVKKPDALVEIFPVVAIETLTRGAVTDPSYQEVIYDVSDPNTVPGTPWEKVKNMGAWNGDTNLLTRTVYVNQDGNQKGKLGCSFSKITTNSWPQKKSFKFSDVELGYYIDVSGNNANNTIANRADDTWIVPWEETWAVTGINLTTKQVRIVRQKRAPIYTERTLKANIDETSPQISGFEQHLRSCNESAESQGSVFSLWGFNSAGLGSANPFTAGNDNVFCQAWKDLSDPLKFANIVAAGAAPNVVCNFTGLSAASLTTGFDGTKYTTNKGKTSTISDYFHTEGSDIVEAQF
jgi:hypothetical protein